MEKQKEITMTKALDIVLNAALGDYESKRLFNEHYQEIVIILHKAIRIAETVNALVKKNMNISSEDFEPINFLCHKDEF